MPAAGLTERQALALALEESRRAAQAAERAQPREDSFDDSSGSSSEDESCAGARARRGAAAKESAAKRKRQAAAAAKSPGEDKRCKMRLLKRFIDCANFLFIFSRMCCVAGGLPFKQHEFPPDFGGWYVVGKRSSIPGMEWPLSKFVQRSCSQAASERGRAGSR